MAYTAVKLTDVQKAIAAVTAANKKYTDAQASSKTTETAVNNARKALETAQSKLQSLQSEFDNQNYLSKNTGYKNASTALSAAEKKLNDARAYLDSGQFLEKNAAYQNSLKAITTAEKNRDAAQTRLDNATDKTRASLERALTAANKTVDTAYTNSDRARQAAEKLAQTAISTAEKAYDTSNANLDKARAAAETAYMNGTIKPAQTAVDKANTTFETAQNKYQGLMDSFQPLLDQRNEAINNVSSYVDTIRGSLGDVTKFADAKQVQTLLGQIQTAVNNTKLSDLINPVKSMISEIDPLKMANIPKVNIQGANPDVFSNIDPNTGLPILDQGGLDAVLDRYKSNKIDTQQYRDNWDKFGWNVKSDASTAMRGPAVVGLDMGTVQQGMQGSRGIVKAGTNQAASDADFKKAADQLGININDYYTTKETTGAYGQRGTAKVLDQQSLYNDIADRTKDFYMVANSIDGNKHAALLFRADGSGNLVPVINQQGAPLANYYTATRNVTGETWYGGLLPIAAIAASFALPGLGGVLAKGIEGTALGAAIGQAGSAALAGAITNAGFAALTGGDIGKAALMGGAGSLAQVESAKIANSALGGAENVQKIADIAGISLKQAQQTIAQGITTGLASAAVTPDNIAENVIANVAGNFGSAKAQNAVSEYMKSSNSLPFMFDAAGNVAKVGAEALVRGEDLSTALQAAAPSIIASGIKFQKDTAATSGSSQAALGEGQVGAMDYRQMPDESQLKFYKVSSEGDPVYIGPDNEIYTITPEGKVSLYVEVGGYEDYPSGPDYSTIQGQVGAGALSSFGNVLGSPSGVGGLGAVSQDDKTKSLPPVEVIGQREYDIPLYNPFLQGTEDYDQYEEYVKASQEFPLTPYTPEQLAGLGTIKAKAQQTVAQQTANKAKQQQALTQQLLDPKSIFYLTPEEQEARGYFNPAEMFESVSSFRKGGLARMKRNTKWQ